MPDVEPPLTASSQKSEKSERADDDKQSVKSGKSGKSPGGSRAGSAKSGKSARSTASTTKTKSGAASPAPSIHDDPIGDMRNMRRIIAEDPEWSLATVPLLSDLCIKHVVGNFECKYDRVQYPYLSICTIFLLVVTHRSLFQSTPRF